MPRPLSAALVAWLVVLAVTQNTRAAEAPVTVYLARKIITMDPGAPIATAVAVQAGKILAVGALDEVTPWLAGRPYTIDRTFADKVLVPGLIEAHGHPIIGASALTRPLLTYLPTPNPYGPGFPGVRTPEQALATLREYVARAKAPDETILAWGYDVVAMGGRQLDKSILDRVSTTQPILVWDASEHFVYANSAGLKKYKIGAEDTKLTGVMTGTDGAPDGRFLGVIAAQRILRAPLEELLNPAVALRNIRFLMDLSRQHGITTTSDLAFGAINLDVEMSLLNAFFNDPNTPVRCVVVTDGATMTDQKGEGAVAFVDALAKRDTERLMFRGVKFFADDAFLSLGMVIENPGYIDGHKGLFITPPDKMVETWLPWWRAGFHIHVHTNGNGGNQATIDALAGLMRAQPRTDHRFTFQHYGISTHEQARRIKALGGVVSVNPYYLYHRSELTAPYIGGDRAHTAARMKTLVDLDVPLSLHSDTPVAPPFPLEEVWIAANRHGLSGEILGPTERVSVQQALRMVTIDAAYTLGVEDKVGSIEPGKFADFAVLDQDPYGTRREVVRDIPVWGTIVGGRVLPASAIKAPR